MRLARAVPIALLAVSVGCAGAEEPPEEYPDAVTADPEHYAVEAENDAVRILRITYGPGEESVMHTHPATCSVALSDATWSMTDTAGETTEDSGTYGEVDCGTEAGTHLPRNTGDSEAELILIEFKEGAMAGSAPASEHPAAVQADPAHYSVEFENEIARIIRIRYGAGESSVMHYHPANCAIYLTDQSATFELPSGEVEEVPAEEPGSVNCVDAGAHLPTNTGDQPLELVLLELKGRATFQP